MEHVIKGPFDGAVYILVLCRISFLNKSGKKFVLQGSRSVGPIRYDGATENEAPFLPAQQILKSSTRPEGSVFGYRCVVGLYLPIGFRGVKVE